MEFLKVAMTKINCKLFLLNSIILNFLSLALQLKTQNTTASSHIAHRFPFMIGIKCGVQCGQDTYFLPWYRGVKVAPKTTKGFLKS